MMWVVVYGLTEGNKEVKEKFWNDLGRVFLDRADKGFRLCVIGDLNGCFGDCEGVFRI